MLPRRERFFVAFHMAAWSKAFMENTQSSKMRQSLVEEEVFWL